MVCISVAQPDLAQLSLDTRTEQSRNLPSLKMTDQAYQSEGDNCSQKKKYSRKELDDLKALAKYKEAFDTFDWNKTSNIATHSLVWALRRVGCNPTETEMLDFINNVDDGSGNVSFQDFCSILTELHKEFDTEELFRNAFRAFYKDEEGNIPAEEMRFVLSNLPGRPSHAEVHQMINTVDRNNDGRIRN